MRDIDPAADAAALARRFALSARSVRVFRASAEFLRLGVAAGLSLRHLAAFYTRASPAASSRLDACLRRAEARLASEAADADVLRLPRLESARRKMSEHASPCRVRVRRSLSPVPRVRGACGEEERVFEYFRHVMRSEIRKYCEEEMDK